MKRIFKYLRLIAAAPDLLEACEANASFTAHIDECAECGELGYCANGAALQLVAMASTENAIAKARGDCAMDR